jgi:chemotaxis protein histidine kinase CheA
LIFVSGVSTSTIITDISGQGVEMDAVRKFGFRRYIVAVRQIEGRVTSTSEKLRRSWKQEVI